MRKSSSYFEQIPVRKVKEIVAAPEIQVLEPLLAGRVPLVLQCRICRKPVPVETAKTDGYGQAVHEQCYILSVTHKPVVVRTRRSQPSS